jgi:hypothetical protein
MGYVCRVPISYLATKLSFFLRFCLYVVKEHVCTALNVEMPKNIANKYQCSLHFLIKNNKGKAGIPYAIDLLVLFEMDY